MLGVKGSPSVRPVRLKAVRIPLVLLVCAAQEPVRSGVDREPCVPFLLWMARSGGQVVGGAMARMPSIWWWTRIMSSMSLMTGVVGVLSPASSVCSFVSSVGQRMSAKCCHVTPVSVCSVSI